MISLLTGETVASIEKRAATIPLTRRVERLAAALQMTPHVLAGPEPVFASAMLSATRPTSRTERAT